jgi:hypothetical protein
MKRTKCEQMQLAVANRMAQGLTVEDIAALQEIQRSNRRAVTAWERANTRDWGQTEQDRLDKVGENAWAKAEKLALAHGWMLEAPGLWWQLMRVDTDGRERDIALPVF